MENGQSIGNSVITNVQGSQDILKTKACSKQKRDCEVNILANFMDICYPFFPLFFFQLLIKP